ncbi:VOC family protein [Thiomicrospira sp. WB1]|uniref:VOC family protein n=1 Tax=Thiomicrospira sp. WB1 TaxID=1685380 RepID=UPI000749DC3A|nr:VOC family protein [Thiomicrospira sp. WB1]KUJ72108.1 glyoxalase [Thiomicrospira sp. WB1]
MGNGIVGVDHVSFLVSDLARSLHFYEGVLQLPRLARPDLGFPGAWLALGEKGQALHLLVLPDPRSAVSPKTLPEHGGRDQHMALQVSDLDAVRQRLDKAGVRYTQSRSGRAALFCRDPDHHALEFFQPTDSSRLAEGSIKSSNV